MQASYTKAVVLGSGLEQLVQYFPSLSHIQFGDIEEICNTSVEGHQGKISFSSPFVFISGRIHFYEGRSLDQIMSPLLWLMKNYDLEEVILTSASGALNPTVNIGSAYEITKLLCFPSVFDWQFDITTTQEYGKKKYCYAYQQGPNLGTLSEYKVLRQLGADFVGMSTYPEFVMLKKYGINIKMITVPTCQYAPFTGVKEPGHSEVLKLANQAVPEIYEMITSEC